MALVAYNLGILSSELECNVQFDGLTQNSVNSTMTPIVSSSDQTSEALVLLCFRWQQVHSPTLAQPSRRPAAPTTARQIWSPSTKRLPRGISATQPRWVEKCYDCAKLK